MRLAARGFGRFLVVLWIFDTLLSISRIIFTKKDFSKKFDLEYMTQNDNHADMVAINGTHEDLLNRGPFVELLDGIVTKKVEERQGFSLAQELPNVRQKFF